MTFGFAIRTATVLVATALLSPTSTAQSVYALDAAGATVVEFDFAGAAPCGYPDGPLLSAFPTPGPWPCPLPGPAVPPPGGLLGDIATNRAADTVWVTDGMMIAEYTAGGVPLRSFPAAGLVPGPLTGLGFGGGLLWVTDGLFVNGVAPPPAPGCLVGPVLLPWPVPAGVGFVTDVDFDPATGTLWVVTAGGMVANLPIGGGPPFFAFPAAPGPCGLALPLTGIARDTATPGAMAAAVLYVTDGVTVARIVPPGGPAAPTFYAGVPCYPIPGGPASGLATALRGLTYGDGCDPTSSTVPPSIGSKGQSTTPSATFGISLSGADPTPGTLAALFVDFAALCPPVPFKGCKLYVLPTLLFGPFPVVGGSFGLAAPIPPAAPVGVTVHAEWVVAKGSGGFQVSNALAFTIGLP